MRHQPRRRPRGGVSGGLIVLCGFWLPLKSSSTKRNEHQLGLAELNPIIRLYGRRDLQLFVVEVEQTVRSARDQLEGVLFTVIAYDRVLVARDAPVARDAYVHFGRTADEIPPAADAIILPAIRSLDADKPTHYRVHADTLAQAADRSFGRAIDNQVGGGLKSRQFDEAPSALVRRDERLDLPPHSGIGATSRV